MSLYHITISSKHLVAGFYLPITCWDKYWSSSFSSSMGDANRKEEKRVWCWTTTCRRSTFSGERKLSPIHFYLTDMTTPLDSSRTDSPERNLTSREKTPGRTGQTAPCKNITQQEMGWWCCVKNDMSCNVNKRVCVIALLGTQHARSATHTHRHSLRAYCRTPRHEASHQYSWWPPAFNPYETFALSLRTFTSSVWGSKEQRE